MHLSKLVYVFVQIAKCIYPKMYLSKLVFVFVPIADNSASVSRYFYWPLAACLHSFCHIFNQCCYFLHNTCELTKHRLTKIRPTKYQATKYRLTFIFEFSSTYLWKLLPRRPLSRTECGTSTTMKVQHMWAGNNY